MNATERVNILLVDDQDAKLLSHEAILAETRRKSAEGIVGAAGIRMPARRMKSPRILIDVCMPDLDGI